MRYTCTRWRIHLTEFILNKKFPARTQLLFQTVCVIHSWCIEAQVDLSDFDLQCYVNPATVVSHIFYDIAQCVKSDHCGLFSKSWLSESQRQCVNQSDITFWSVEETQLSKKTPYLFFYLKHLYGHPSMSYFFFLVQLLKLKTVENTFNKVKM